MYTINPMPHLTPKVSISPFDVPDIGYGDCIDDILKFDDYFDNRFGAGNWKLVENGRDALKTACEVSFSSGQSIYMSTTYRTAYLSSCVSEVFEKCGLLLHKQSMKKELNFYNVEFGSFDTEYCNAKIIDKCTSFFVDHNDKALIENGRIVLLSLPKFFNVQRGGVLAMANIRASEQESSLNDVKKIVGKQLIEQDQIIDARKKVYDFLSMSLRELNLEVFNSPSEKEVPYVLMVDNSHGLIKDLNRFKTFMNRHGIESTIFYGLNVFMIPCHQRLKESESRYIIFLFNYYINHINED